MSEGTCTNCGQEGNWCKCDDPLDPPTEHELKQLLRVETHETLEFCPLCNGIGSRRGDIEKLIVGAIKDGINAHGVMYPNVVPSIAKRIIGALKAYTKERNKK